MKTRPFCTMVDKALPSKPERMYHLYTWSRARVGASVRPAASSSSLRGLKSTGHLSGLASGMDAVIVSRREIVWSSGGGAETIARRIGIAD